jgi:hypothetical protein
MLNSDVINIIHSFYKKLLIYHDLQDQARDITYFDLWAGHRGSPTYVQVGCKKRACQLLGIFKVRLLDVKKEQSIPSPLIYNFEEFFWATWPEYPARHVVISQADMYAYTRWEESREPYRSTFGYDVSECEYRSNRQLPPHTYQNLLDLTVIRRLDIY